MSGKTLKAIKFLEQDILLQLLDQLKLPYATSYIDVKSIEDAFQAIKLMQVRGAPAIAITGAFAIAVDISNQIKLGRTARTITDLISDIDYLITSRPTAVNLSNACADIKGLLRVNFSELEYINNKALDIVLTYSLQLYKSDLLNNFKIGDNGVEYITETLKSQNFSGPFSIMTVCNTGSLATSGHGTALGIIRSVFMALSKSVSKELFWFDRAFPLETRPYNQGAKLTTYELQYEEIPFTLICDNMATSLISTLRKGKAIHGATGPVKFIIAGADRIVKNGDTANKIGTYQLAALANHFNSTSEYDIENISFIIAAPNTTIDGNTDSGEGITIEERPGDELTTLKGPYLDADMRPGEKCTIGLATPGIEVWNPAFDVTPHELIDCIITEDQAMRKQDGVFLL